MKDKKKRRASISTRRKNREEASKLTQKNDLSLTSKYRQEIRQNELQQIRTQMENGLQEAQEIIHERQKRIQKLIITINSEIDQMLEYLSKVDSQFVAIRHQNMPQIPIDLEARIGVSKVELFKIFEKFKKEFDFEAFELFDGKFGDTTNFEKNEIPASHYLDFSPEGKASASIYNDDIFLRREIVQLEEELERLEIRELADEKIQQKKIKEVKEQVGILQDRLKASATAITKATNKECLSTFNQGF
uniref:Uncharacterized protein n=1 Tax=Acrobeloides nanus TaxID=290746 RepID=A0A914C4G9_9BILA